MKPRRRRKLLSKWRVTMNDEIILTGGRMTPGVVRIDNLVYRPMSANSSFVHEILVF